MTGSKSFERDGFLVLPRFLDQTVATDLLDAAVELARRNARDESIGPAFVTPEANLAEVDPRDPEDAVSKIFRVHSLEPFHSFVAHPDVVDQVATVLGFDDIDCFGSQFIYKNPGAWGQPCHQDAHYFPFTPARPVVAAWLATTRASEGNGGLFVVPGSHTEPVHEHVPDRRPNANLGYFEIVDHDLSGAICVEMEPGDLLLFDSHLMHFSNDNKSSERRCAMVCHYARTGTTDHAPEEFGFTIHQWMTVRSAI